MAMTTINSTNVKAEHRLWCSVRIGRAPRLDGYTAKCEYDPANAVVFEEHDRANLELTGLGNVQLKGICQRLARLDPNLFVALRTEAAVLSSARREAENSRRLVGLIGEPNDHVARTNRSFTAITVRLAHGKHGFVGLGNKGQPSGPCSQADGQNDKQPKRVAEHTFSVRAGSTRDGPGADASGS